MDSVTMVISRVFQSFKYTYAVCLKVVLCFVCALYSLIVLMVYWVWKTRLKSFENTCKGGHFWWSCILSQPATSPKKNCTTCIFQLICLHFRNSSFKEDLKEMNILFCVTQVILFFIFRRCSLYVWLIVSPPFENKDE